jgi:rhomboid protease GluP
LAIVFGVVWRQVRRSYRLILAAGVSVPGTITSIGRESKDGLCTVRFRYQTESGASLQSTQPTSSAAVAALGLVVGSSVQVHYLRKWPRWGFIEPLAVAERRAELLRVAAAAPGEAPGEAPASELFFVDYAAGNPYRWSGGGDVLVDAEQIMFSAAQARPFWIPKLVQRTFPLSAICDVEQVEASLKLSIEERARAPVSLQLSAVDQERAQALARRLPQRKSAGFVPTLTESAAFDAALLRLTPAIPVTQGLIAVNGLMFLVAAALGGGVFVPNAEAMIRLGTDYTPLTLGGQWWRLLTSTFLHFGLLHLAFNMWALYVNGRVAERIYGSLRYLIIYVVAGLSGSVASLFWHPIVNGAGASGAIFGVLGALIAFFLQRRGSVPPSVIKSQRASAAVFVAYNLLNGVGHRGIDNAAHLGGLFGGFVMAYVLARPISPERADRPWTAQWVVAGAIALAAAALIARGISSGNLAPRVAHDKQGYPIPLAALEPPVQTLGGFRIGMTPEEVRRLKGEPINKSSLGWVYNSVDNRHDGVLTIAFGQAGDGDDSRIGTIEFAGRDPGSAPPELPFLGGKQRLDLIEAYGQPIARQSFGESDWENLWFRNGVVVRMHRDRVSSYGIFDAATIPKWRGMRAIRGGATTRPNR